MPRFDVLSYHSTAQYAPPGRRDCQPRLLPSPCRGAIRRPCVRPAIEFPNSDAPPRTSVCGPDSVRFESAINDAEGSRRLKNLESAAHIKIKEIVRVFLAAAFVDTVPGGDVDNALAAAKYVCQFRPVQNGPLDKHPSLFQIPWRTNIQNDRCVAFGKQHRYEGLAEISRPSGQKHLHYLLPYLPLSV